MAVLLASDFADHPYVDVHCHGLPMDVIVSEHIRETVQAIGDAITHRIVRRCPLCTAIVVTSLMAPAKIEVPT